MLSWRSVDGFDKLIQVICGIIIVKLIALKFLLDLNPHLGQCFARKCNDSFVLMRRPRSNWEYMFNNVNQSWKIDRIVKLFFSKSANHFLVVVLNEHISVILLEKLTLFRDILVLFQFFKLFNQISYFRNFIIRWLLRFWIINVFWASACNLNLIRILFNFFNWIHSRLGIISISFNFCIW